MTPFIAKFIEQSCVTTHADCPLDDLIATLAERRIGTVVVIDRDQQVIGIVWNAISFGIYQPVAQQPTPSPKIL